VTACATGSARDRHTAAARPPLIDAGSSRCGVLRSLARLLAAVVGEEMRLTYVDHLPPTQAKVARRNFKK